jgi:transposase
MTYSLDFRRKVLKSKEKEKLTFASTAERFGMSKNTVLLWSKDIEPKRRRNKPATKLDMEALKKDIETYPDAYQYERAARLGVTATGIWHALKRLKVTYKKNPHASQGGCRKTFCFLQKSQRIQGFSTSAGVSR